MKPKQSRVLEAAAALFVQHGYDKTSTEMIADAADVSRQTIYNQFGSKEALFLAIAEALTRDLTAAIAQPVDVGADLARTLESFGRQFLRIILAERNVAIYRMVVSEVSRFPALSEAVYRQGVRRTEEQVAAYLSAQSGLRLDDATFAARAFLALIAHPIHLQSQLGLQVDPDGPEVVAHVAAAVALFLRAYYPARHAERIASARPKDAAPAKRKAKSGSR